MKTSSPTPSQKHRILIVDDHPMMRLGLRQFLAQEADLVICGEATNARDTLSAVEQLKPNLVLLDITLQGRSGLDLLKDLQISFAQIPVLIHSMHDETIFAERALRAGARGYLMKRETGENIISAIRQVLRGETYLSKALRSQTADSSARCKSPRPKSPIAALSLREFEIFRLIGLGNTNHDIARQLHLSLKTVEAHREHIKSKLSLSTSTALNLMAVRWETENAGA